MTSRSKRPSLTAPSSSPSTIPSDRGSMIPGEYVLRSEPLTVNAGREAIAVVVVNTGDRPVQVGSHYHFAEANRALEFDRMVAHGRRLDIPAGTAARFEPGDSRTVRLIALGGSRE